MIGNRFYLFSLISVVVLVFLIYTLLNLDSLGISITHPRVLVELGIFLISLILALREFLIA